MPPALGPAIERVTTRPPLHNAFWSILVEEEDGRVVYAQNAEKLTIPASNRKLFASAAIATCLGLETRLSTGIWRDGEDLVIRGGGDPSLGSWRYERDGDFDALAIALRERGITRVHDVVADVSAFDRVTIPGSWKYGNLGQDYAAPVDALAWGENEIADDRSVPEPAIYTASTLRDALVLHGIDVTGSARVNFEPRAWSEHVMDLPSPFVGQLLYTVLKNSHNLYAEMLLKQLGGTPATYDGALDVERAFLTSDVRVPDDAFRFVDGSGLAPDDLLTPHAVIRILRWMNDPARRGYWWSVLAQPKNEGTLRSRLVTLESRLRGKTGTINGVAALSGIIAMPSGRYRYFSAIINHHNADDAAAALDEVVELIAKE